MITGITQWAGKTTALEALVSRSGLRAITFLTKPEEQEFSGRGLPLFFKERADWQYVESLISATLREDQKFNRSFIIKASRGCKTLREVWDNIKKSKAAVRDGSFLEGVYTVTAETPLIVRNQTTGIVDVVPIQDLCARLEIPRGQAEVVVPVKGLDVLGRDGFTPIKWLSMHGLKQSTQVVTPGGAVRVSDGHSLFDETGNLIRGSEAIAGKTKLLVRDLPVLDVKTWVDPELAWLFGLFVAEGSCGTYKGGVSQFVIYNKDLTLLEKAAAIYTKHYGFETRVTAEINGARRLLLLGPPNRKFNPVRELFEAYFYTKYRSRLKKVPALVLNAQAEARIAFLQGYNEGDGSKGHYKYQFQRFTTNSETLAQGLLLLMASTVRQRTNVMPVGKDKQFLALAFNSPYDYHNLSSTRLSENLVKSVLRRREKIGYDIETVDHSFVAGVGGIVTHNTNLDAYMEIVVPQIEKYQFSETLEFGDGLNIMDLREMSDEMQALVIRSVIEYLADSREKDITVIVPEAWKFIGETYTPVQYIVEKTIRQGASSKVYVWIDSQNLSGIAGPVRSQVGIWFLGIQRYEHEVDRTIKAIPLEKKPKKNDIMNLNTGEFIVCTRREVEKIYVQPSWLPAELAVRVAKGELESDSDEVQSFRKNAPQLKAAQVFKKAVESEDWSDVDKEILRVEAKL